MWSVINLASASWNLKLYCGDQDEDMLFLLLYFSIGRPRRTPDISKLLLQSYMMTACNESPTQSDIATMTTVDIERSID